MCLPCKWVKYRPSLTQTEKRILMVSADLAVQTFKSQAKTTISAWGAVIKSPKSRHEQDTYTSFSSIPSEADFAIRFPRTKQEGNQIVCNLITCYDLTYDFEIESVDFILRCFLLPFLRVVCFKQVRSQYHNHDRQFSPEILECSRASTVPICRRIFFTLKPFALRGRP